MTCKNCGKNINTAGPKPYYEEVNDEVKEDHKQYLVGTTFAVGVSSPDSFNIPNVDEDVAVVFPDVINIIVGAYLYNPQYGFLKITHWNPHNWTVGLMNDNIEGTAAPGTYVKEGTKFVVTPKPCCSDAETASIFPYLAEDFTAQNIGDDRTVQVTSTFGLRLGEIIRIGSATYRLTLINSSKEIVINNEGGGYAPGTNVEAKDVNGNFQYLLYSENTDICASNLNTTGRLIVCDGTDQRILSGSFIGQVPVLIDAGAHVAEYAFMDADPRVCTTLTADVEVGAVMGTPQAYTLPVADSTGIAVSDVLQINFGPQPMRFVVTAVAPNSIDVVITPNQHVVYAAGQYVCRILTAEIAEDLLILANGYQAAHYEGTTTAATGGGAITAGNSIAGNDLDIVITNPSTRSFMAGLFTGQVSAALQLNDIVAQLNVGTEIVTGLIGTTGGLIGSGSSRSWTEEFTYGTGPDNFTFQIPFSRGFLILPGYEARCRATFTAVAYTGSGALTRRIFQTHGEVIAVAL